jgi:type VI secretion system protein ImpL
MKKWIFNKKIKTEKENEHQWWREHAEAKINLLKEKVNEAFALLKTKKSENASPYKDAPWFLVIGAENSGKTSLLSKSHLALTSIDGKPLTHTGPTAYCDWWLSKKAVFIDTSGGLIMPRKSTDDAYYIWHKFIDLLHEHRRDAPVDGVILCVDLYDFQSKSHEDQKRQIDVFRHRIQTLRKYKCALPIHLVFTKCDHIAGFTESYNGLALEEMQQIFGLSLPDKLPQRNLPEVLDEKFNTLLKQMSEQLLGYLHREHCVKKRALIKNFPLQIESQKRGITLLANQLHSQKTTLRTICFTSALQDGKTYDILKAQSHHFGLPVSSRHENFHTPQQQRSFFIQSLIKKIIKESLADRPKKTRNFIQGHTKLYATCSSVLMILGLLITYSYYHEKDILSNTQLTLNASQSTLEENDQAIIAELAMLKKAINTVDQRKQLITQVFFGQNRQLRKDLQNAYDLTLQTKFSDMLAQFFETKLQNPDSLNSKTLFDILKIYTMLKNPAQAEQSFLSTWFANSWKDIYPNQPATQKILLSALNDWVSLQPKDFSVPENTISLAQKKLNGVSLSTLAYFQLQDLHDTGEHQANAGKFFSIYLPNKNSLYTPENFLNIYQHEIPKIAKQITSNDHWVIQLDLPDNFKKPVTEQLIEDLRKLYAQNYAVYWQTQLFAATLNNFENISDADTFAATFGSKDSPITQLLDVIEEKLNPLKDLPQAKEPLTVQHQIRTMLTTAPSDKRITDAINELKRYLSKLNSSEHKNRAVLIATQERMKYHENDPLSNLSKQAESAPPPIKNWLQALAKNTWSTMLKISQHQLNLVWITEILPAYNETIKDRYPIFSNAKNEMPLNTFTAFFGPEGVLTRFLERELSPFVNSEKLYWTWKKVDDLQLNIHQDTLDMINVASLIKQMFFPANEKNPLLKFAIMPTVLTDASENYLLNLAGSTIDYSRDANRSKNLIWPSGHSSSAWLEVKRNKESQLVMEEKGEWALFKLLSYATIETTQNTRYFEVVFNANGMSVPYKLMADDPVNPFIPDLFTTFRCPKDLM